MHSTAIVILLVLLVGCVVGLAARWVRLPYTLALVIAGVGLGFVDLEPLAGVSLTGDLLFTFLLPALLFEAAYHVDARDLLRSARPILLLAVPGVLVAAGVTAAIAYGLIGATHLREFGVLEAAIFASVLAATDPISVLALFKELGVSRDLYLQMEGESLVNDGVAMVVFAIVAAVAGFSVGHGEAVALEGAGEIGVYAVRTFIWMTGGGMVIGGLIGVLAGTLSRQIDDRLVEITITTVVAFGSFLLAEQVGCSGVLCTVTAGITTGSFGARYGMSTRTRLAVEDFWEYAAFLANTFVFLLVGLELRIVELGSDLLPIVLGFVAVLAGRSVAVGMAVPLSGRGLPNHWAPVLIWGGLRGSLSMVLILALPTDFAGRQLLIHLVFGVVSASLFVQGMTIKPLLARLGLSRTASEAQRSLERCRARIISTTRALSRLEHMQEEGLVVPAVARRLHHFYEQRRAGAHGELEALVGEEIVAEQMLQVSLSLAAEEREALRHAVRMDVVGPDAAEHVLAELDERAEALRRAGHDGMTADEVDALLPRS